MSAYHQTQRPMMAAAWSQRLNELFEAIRNEFEGVSQDTSVFKMQRDEFEHKIAAQIQEMNQIQQNVYELERAHQRMKQQYEDEIMRLRRELEARGGVPPPSSIQLPSQASSSAIGGPSLGAYASAEDAKRLQQQPPPQGQQQPPQEPPRTMYGQPPMRKPDQPPQGMYGHIPQHPPQHHPMQPHPMQQSMHVPQQMPPQRPPPPVVHPPQQRMIPLFGDVDPESIPASFKREGGDWISWFNPKIPRTLDLNLVHNLDHPSVVCCVKFSYDGKYLATGCNRLTHIYDVTQGQKIATLADETGKEGDLYIRSVCFSPDGRYLATGAEDKQIRIWDIKQNKIKTYLKGHEQDIYSLDYSRDGRFLASGSGDKTAKLWDVESSKCLHSFTEEETVPKDAGVTSVALSPDGRFLASGSLDRHVRIWDTTSGQLVTKLEGHKDSVYSVAFSPDGQSLVSGSLDKTLKLWDLTPGKTDRCKMTFPGHRDFVLSVAFSPEGNYVISGSKDRSVQFWDHRTGQPLFILQGHKNSVISVALSPMGNTFATGSGDCRSRIWSLDAYKS